MKRVFFVLLPQVHMLDFGGPLQVLGSLPELGIAPVELYCVGPIKELSSFQGAVLSSLQPLPLRLERGDLVIVVGCKFKFDGPPDQAQAQVVRWLQMVVMPRLPDITLASVCTGAFLLGAAGLLDGRNCTTHHDHLTRLQRYYPQARVLDSRILVEDGPLITSAGVSAGMDLALHLIARNFGHGPAIRIARENMISFRRLSEDPKLDFHVSHRNHNHPVIHAVQDFLTENLSCDLSYEELANRFAHSYRHLARLFQQEAGITIKQYQQQLRLSQARRLLRDSNWSVERIAEGSGFASTQAFRSAWRQVEPLAPSMWREHYAHSS